jgi:uncharacterized protein involved in copper resistance
MNRAAMPHTNGSHTGMPRKVGDAYSHAPVRIDTASASGPNRNPIR